MESLKERKVIIDGNGHPMKVGFNQYGNKHLYNDAFHGIIDKEELLSLDQMLQKATFVTKAGLSKQREDDFKRFYYYRTINRRGVEVFLNVGETDYTTKKGMIKHKRYLYAITYTIKEE